MHDAGAAGLAAAFILIARLCIAGVFIRAGAVKLTDLGEFRLAVANYRILPDHLVALAALVVPAAEAAGGVLLLLGVFPGIVAAVLAVLLGCFAAAIAVNLARRRVFDCDCGGSTTPRLISWRHVVTDVILALTAATIAIVPPGGLDLLLGEHGVYPIAIPSGSAPPLVLAAALVFLTARVLGAAATTYRPSRTLRSSRPVESSSVPG